MILFLNFSQQVNVISTSRRVYLIHLAIHKKTRCCPNLWILRAACSSLLPRPTSGDALTPTVSAAAFYTDPCSTESQGQAWSTSSIAQPAKGIGVFINLAMKTSIMKLRLCSLRGGKGRIGNSLKSYIKAQRRGRKQHLYRRAETKNWPGNYRMSSVMNGKMACTSQEDGGVPVPVYWPLDAPSMIQFL